MKFEKLEGGHPRFYELLEDIANLHAKKNTDYAKGGIQGHLGNFYRSAQFKQMYPGFDWSTAFGTAIDYMFKQLDAAMILYATRRGSVTGEGVQERLQDVTIYANLARIILEEEGMPNAKQPSLLPGQGEETPIPAIDPKMPTVSREAGGLDYEPAQRDRTVYTRKV
jgi:hypothetical protein